MAEAQWYCAECETFGGGPPNNMTPEEHIEFAHDGGLARIQDASDRFRNS